MDNVIWFCDKCGSANPISILDCDNCNAPMVKECLVFNTENFQGVVPADQARPQYFVDGGASLINPPQQYYSEWK